MFHSSENVNHTLYLFISIITNKSTHMCVKRDYVQVCYDIFFYFFLNIKTVANCLLIKGLFLNIKTSANCLCFKAYAFICN